MIIDHCCLDLLFCPLLNILLTWHLTLNLLQMILFDLFSPHKFATVNAIVLANSWALHIFTPSREYYHTFEVVFLATCWMQYPFSSSPLGQPFPPRYNVFTNHRFFKIVEHTKHIFFDFKKSSSYMKGIINQKWQYHTVHYKTTVNNKILWGPK